MSLIVKLEDRLLDPSLLSAACPVAGEWRDVSASGERFDVLDPSDGSVIISLPDFGPDEVRAAIDAGYRAQVAWGRRSAKDRSAVLRRLHDLLIENRDDLAAILTAEMGKPLAEARAEIAYGAAYVEWYAEEAKRLYGETIPGHLPDKRILVLRQPVGVVAAIAPWNFPNAMLARKIAPALAVGCSVVCKPAAETPLSAIAIAVLAERAGLPAGLLHVLPTRNAQGFGAEVCSNDKVRKLTFTGSTGVGQHLIAQAAKKVLRLSMELGGNAPFIVFDDADLDAAVDGAMAAKYRNAGQTCVCANRIYVQSGIHDRFVARLAERVAALKVGNGFDDGVTIGPLITDKAIAKLREHLDDAVAKGATVVAGGQPHPLGGNFVQPTVVTGVTSDMLVARDETFAPLAPVFRFETEAEVLTAANDTEFGLAAYFYTCDMARTWRVMEALEYGMVGVNTGLISTEVAPFGGIKQSGFGREGSSHGLEDYTELKYVCMQVD